MPTPKKGPRLASSPAHERLMLANMATSLFQNGRITTTLPKAKRLRPLAERLITFAKRGDLHSRRRVMRVIRNKSVVHKLFTEIAEQMEQREGGYTFDEVDEMMNKKSGLLAVTGGKTNDCRNVEELAAAGDPEAQLAFDMFVYKIAAKAAEMATSMCGMDTLVFTAGIGEHAPAVRAGVADRLAFMGVKMDHARNALRGDGAWCLSAKDSKVKIFVIPTDEEFMIASDVERIVNGK